MNSLDNMSDAFLETTVRETLDLLSAATLTPGRSYHAQASATSVSIFASPDHTRPNTIRVEVYCYDSGHLAIDWDGIPIILIDRSTDHEWLTFFDPRGRADFIVTAAPDKAILTFEALGPRPVVEYMGVTSRGHFGFHAPLTFDVWSADGRLRADAKQEADRLHIKITTNDATLSPSAVRVVFRSDQDTSKPPLQRLIRMKGVEGKGHVLMRDVPKNAKMMIFLPRNR